MLTTTHILEAFAALHTAAIPAPKQWSGQNPESIAQTWAAILADVSPEALQASVLAYIRSGESYWPTPGKLLKLAIKISSGPGINLHTEFRWLVDTAHRCWGDLHVDGVVHTPQEQFQKFLNKRYQEGMPAQLQQAVNRFGGIHSLQAVYHTRDSEGLKDFGFRLRDFTRVYNTSVQEVEDSKVLQLSGRIAKRLEG